MERCFALAEKAGRNTRTNPKVGCVIVYQSRVIGEGYHKCYGGPHAEIEALASITSEDMPLLHHSTMYVSLEPCSHFGKTPPCAHKIVEMHIPEVVIGCLDPNPLVAGNGVNFLESHGVKVRFSNTEAAENIIRKFVKNLHGKPYITLKWAQSVDGFMGRPNEQVWISSQETSVLTHFWRSQTDAIAVGKNTFLTDRPQLTDRIHQNDHQPIKILFDSTLSCKPILEEMTTHQYIIINTVDQRNEGAHTYIKADIQNLNEITDILFRMGITSIIIEGGAKLLSSFIRQNMWDEATIITTNIRLVTGIKAPLLTGKAVKKWRVGNDIIHQIYNVQ